MKKIILVALLAVFAIGSDHKIDFATLKTAFPVLGTSLEKYAEQHQALDLNALTTDMIEAVVNRLDFQVIMIRELQIYCKKNPKAFVCEDSGNVSG